MGRGRVLVVGIALLVVIAGGCDDDGSSQPTAAAARELRAAARRTLAEQSFRVRVVATFGKQHFVADGEYLGPDRTQLGSGSTNRIIIGDTMYQRFGDDGVAATDPNVYYRTVVPATSRRVEPGSDLTALLQIPIRKRAPVSFRDGLFRMTLPGNERFSASRMMFRIERGRVTDATLDYTVRQERQAQKHHYFDFGAPISIKAPPAAVTRDTPTASTCVSGPDPRSGVTCSAPAP